MKITLEKCDNESARFKLSEASIAFANAIRRIAMSQLQVMGIDTVTFYENDSALFDEYIANRIGLVPLESPDGYTEKDVVLFSLDKSGPGIVYSKSLKSSDAKVKVANKNIPLMSLSDGQSLRLEAKARLGTGKEHAKYQAGMVTYDIEDAEKGVFNFYVESFGQIPASEIMKKSVAVLEDKIKEFEKEQKEAEKELKAKAKKKKN